MFKLCLHTKDLALLYAVKYFFGGEIGNINVTRTRQEAIFSIHILSDLINIIIPHFKNYPLKSAKSIDFYLWKNV